MGLEFQLRPRLCKGPAVGRTPDCDPVLLDTSVTRPAWSGLYRKGALRGLGVASSWRQEELQGG